MADYLDEMPRGQAVSLARACLKRKREPRRAAVLHVNVPCVFLVEAEFSGRVLGLVGECDENKTIAEIWAEFRRNLGALLREQRLYIPKERRSCVLWLKSNWREIAVKLDQQN